jgi:hypothetical protein
MAGVALLFVAALVSSLGEPLDPPMVPARTADRGSMDMDTDTAAAGGSYLYSPRSCLRSHPRAKPAAAAEAAPEAATLAGGRDDEVAAEATITTDGSVQPAGAASVNVTTKKACKASDPALGLHLFEEGDYRRAAAEAVRMYVDRLPWHWWILLPLLRLRPEDVGRM